MNKTGYIVTVWYGDGEYFEEFFSCEDTADNYARHTMLSGLITYHGNIKFFYPPHKINYITLQEKQYEES